jgi:hypothetical protein
MMKDVSWRVEGAVLLLLMTPLMGCSTVEPQPECAQWSREISSEESYCDQSVPGIQQNHQPWYFSEPTHPMPVRF